MAKSTQFEDWFQLLTGRFATTEEDMKILKVKPFQLLIGRLATLAEEKNILKYNEFQLLIGRLATQRGRGGSEEDRRVSTPYR